MLALAALIVLVVGLVRRADPPVAGPPRTEPAIPSTMIEPAGPTKQNPVTPPATSATPGPRRVLVPPPAEPITPRVPRLARGGELVDRREGPPEPDTQEQREALGATMAAVEEDVEDCLRDWSKLDPAIHGRVSMAFQIDEKGLGKLWIQDHEQIPEGPMTCFASAIYSVDWSHISRKPIEISNHFVIEDGAPAQVDLRGPSEKP
jgi:hypothetical protein